MAKRVGLACAARILNVYIEVFTAFSHRFGTDGLKNTLLSQGSVIETAPKPEGLPAAEDETALGGLQADSCHEPCCCRCGIWLPLLLCSEFSVKLSLCADEIHAT